MGKVLITGGKGQLAYDCNEVLKQKHEVFLLNSRQLDISDPVAVQNRLSQLEPDYVLNCAAFTKVDSCETEKKKAWRVNAVGPENLAAGIEARGGKMIHISTDYVFDGRRRLPGGYGEADLTGPISYYGKSKLAGESVVRQRSSSFLVIRTAWLYGIGGPNFFKTMLKLAISNPEQEIKVVNDQYGSPTWTFRLAQQIDKLIDEEATGTFHATADGYASWYESALFFLEKMDVPHRIIPCTTAQYPLPAKRPANSILENKRLHQHSLSVMRNWREDMEEFAGKYRDDLLREAESESQQ
jgi:dTDP-4-dehydrorhamnose reductase